jgi:quinol monooxygenase YgiN
MSCQVVVEFRVKEGCVETLRTWLRDILPVTRGYEGCLTLNVAQDQDDPNHIVVVEQWASRKHHERFIEWRAERGDLDPMIEMLEGEATTAYFDYFGV